MRLTLAALALAGISACAPSNLRAQIAAADAREAEQRGETDQLAVDAASLLADYDHVTRDLADAESRFAMAGQDARVAADDSLATMTAYNETQRNWRWMTYVVLAAATWDLAGEICGGVQSTRSYRRELGLDRSVCVDHSFAHAIGGINHPWNYMPLDCAANSAYGAAFWTKLVAMPVPVLRGLAASAVARLRCGSMASAWAR